MTPTQRPRGGRQAGAAIVLAMSIVTMASIAAMGIMVSQSTWTRRHELQAQHKQAQMVAEAGIDWSRAVLGDDAKTGSVDHLGEPWAIRLPSMPVENGKLEGFLEDEQGKFNLNNLVKDGKADPAEVKKFRRLLFLLGLPLALSDKVVDWIDADGELQPAGAEDGYYLARQPPYLAANRALTDIGELGQVDGFNQNVRARLAPFITALPSATLVNVNTAPPEVLAAIVDGLGLDGARTLAAARKTAYFRDPADFAARLPGSVSGDNENVVVNSSYFLTTINAEIGEASAKGIALLARQGTGWPRILWRKTL